MFQSLMCVCVLQCQLALQHTTLGVSFLFPSLTLRVSFLFPSLTLRVSFLFPSFSLHLLLNFAPVQGKGPTTLISLKNINCTSQSFMFGCIFLDAISSDHQYTFFTESHTTIILKQAKTFTIYLDSCFVNLKSGHW